ncbi:MAG TPA: hypothetical protein VH599_20835 [Ktedonobacterales bacterium]|jgi:hypothetical protein
METSPALSPREQEQQRLLAIVRAWHPSAFPEYRGFRCALCQASINEAWYHWLQTDEYHIPVHLCNERCESLFQAGKTPIDHRSEAPGARPSASNVYPFTQEAISRFREIVGSWPTGAAPELRAFTCDACGGVLVLEPGPDGSQRRQGYHVWWTMEPGITRAEFHFHRACGHALGIYSQEEREQRHGEHQ